MILGEQPLQPSKHRPQATRVSAEPTQSKNMKGTVNELLPRCEFAIIDNCST